MLLLGEGTVITRNPAQPMITRGAVVMDGKTIIAVGGYDELKAKYPDAAVINAHGKLIMPAFINAHHHIYSALARGLALPNYNPTNFNEILEGMWFYLDNNLNRNSVWASAVATYMACIENGVTTIFDHHASYGETTGSLSVIGDVAKEFGVRSCLCYEVSDRNGQEAMEAAVAENVRFGRAVKAAAEKQTAQSRATASSSAIAQTAQSGAADDSSAKADKTADSVELAAMFGLHASFTLSPATLDYVRKQNTDGLGYHIHVAEGKSDEEDSLAKYGKRVVNRLYDEGILGPTTITGHCIHIDADELALLQKTNTMVVHNPESNMGNAVGAPDILAMTKAGLRVGLGTDGYTSDMLESYKAANCLVKHRSGLPNQGWVEIPTMLFDTNRKMAEQFFNITTGILTPGAAADVIVMDYEPPTRLTADNINGHLLFGANGMNVVTTISNGVVRYQDRQWQGLDKQALFGEVREIAEELWRQLKV
ncbi:MAG: putative aminohydrolase SsnA [Veillonella sp.]|uniref:putative aminohydrolase SsnA n=1 Tax=Veillonella sp. TaxID=1926307 RepID=UPI0025FE21D3|nr:putative aminohydrolase SsnA [Veillonella sp.]MBE6080602.1 putative aminohydrolase SsnA [Veillonella sp.]